MISNEQFIKLIKSPKNANEIAIMRKLEAEIAAFSTGEGFDVILDYYARLYVPEMRSTILELFKPHSKKLLAPYTGTVHAHFSKVFDSYEKRSIDFNFSKKDLYNDFFEYTQSCYLGDIGALQFSKEFLTKDILYSPNTRYYVDFKTDIDNEIGFSKPVIKRITSPFIHDIEETEGVTNYIIFSEFTDSNSIKEYYLIDGNRFVKAIKAGNDWVVDKSSEVIHEYGYTPVCAASNATLFIKGRQEVKKSVISDSINDLNDWTLAKNQDKVFFWRNQTPREYMVSSKCKGTYDNGTHYDCNDGYYYRVNSDYDINNNDLGDVEATTKLACPSCARKKQEQNKFGNVVDVHYEDLIRNSDKISSIKDGFGFISTDVKMLDFSKGKVEQGLAEIETTIIGRASNANIFSKAVNEKQVRLSGESKEQTLTSFAEQIEAKEMFLFDLLGKGRYGDKYSNTNVFLGRRWVFSENSLVEDIKLLRESGASATLLKRKEDELIQSSYSYDNDFKAIIKLTNAIIPFQTVGIPELITNSDAYIAASSEIEFNFRLNIEKLITYLEREFKNDISLQLMPFEEQTKVIYTKFLMYLKKD